ncbi:MAG: Gfo/Idh/MocA family oxidoreductase [Methylobacteriaceae bacterium]|nr:Gfo/Idh/MocA family oxidoreductase [Methylobacteriaceae bacterium]
MAGASETVPPRVAVVGCGRWGRNHVRNHAELGSLAAVVDHHPDRARELGAAHDVPALSFEAALADPSVEALVFALPPSQNLPLGRWALAAGKHLFVEKPLALSVVDGAALCEAAERHDRRLMVGHILQYHPAFLALRDLVWAGRLGRLLSVVSTRLDLGRIRREEDAMWALAPHDLSMILALVGAEPASVAASGGFHTHPAIADATHLELGFPGGLRAEIRSSWLHPIKEQRLVVVGTDAMAVFDDREPWERKLVLTPSRLAGAAEAPAAEGGEPEPLPVEPGEPLKRECRHFLDCIRTGARPITDGREGLGVLAVLERASAALRASLPR